jgi:hypothetical protein
MTETTECGRGLYNTGNDQYEESEEGNDIMSYPAPCKHYEGKGQGKEDNNMIHVYSV